jgi:hypothetical protein
MEKQNEFQEPAKDQVYKCTSKIDFFTKEMLYQVEKVEYENGTETNWITLIDDDNHKHPVDENFLQNNFKLT